MHMYITFTQNTIQYNTYAHVQNISYIEYIQHMQYNIQYVHTHTCKMYIRTHNTYIYTLGIQYNSYINTYTCIEYTCVHTHTHITHAYNTFEHIHRHGFYPCTHITQGQHIQNKHINNHTHMYRVSQLDVLIICFTSLSSKLRNFVFQASNSKPKILMQTSQQSLCAGYSNKGLHKIVK